MKKIILLLFLLSSFVIANAQSWKLISAGEYFSMVIKNDSTIWGLGQGVFGQLGNGTSNNTTCPTRVNNPLYWQSVTTGDMHTIAIRFDGTLWAFGDDRNGQLGDGTAIFGKYVYSPEQIGIATNWKTISAGHLYTVAIKADGTLWAWGDNHTGKLGDGTTVDKYIPTQIGTSTDWQIISAGTEHTLAIKTDGTLWAWGDNYYGNLGNGTTNPSPALSPIQIGTDNNWKSVSAGNAFSVGIKSDGTLWTWGYNINGQLGDATNIDKHAPTQTGTGANWKSVSAGDNHCIAVKTDGTLWGWGYNAYGQIGDNTNVDKNVPVQDGNYTDWQTIEAGGNHSIGIKNDSTLWAWGEDGLYTPTEITCEIVLPITLTSFTAQKQRETTLLTWQTATEQNNKEYQIERSSDGVTFKKIGVVASKNNLSGSKYTYVDAYPLFGNDYYRLKSVDIDRKFSYSNIDKVTFNLNANNVIVYPNPAKDILIIQSNFKGEKLNIIITDLAGRKILQTIKTNNQLIEIQIPDLGSGLYLLKINDGITSVSKKIIKE